MTHPDSTNAPLVVAVLLNWNGAEFTIPCVRSLQEQTYPNLATVVVDNGSRDDSVERLQRELGTTITLMTVAENNGFSAVCNLGIDRALEMGADYVLVMNNDTLLDPPCIAALVETAQSDAAIGAVTGKIMYHEPRNLIWCAGGDVRRGFMRFQARGLDEVDRGQFDMVTESPFVCGCLMLIPRAVVTKVGAFDGRFFAYEEDGDLSVRIAAAGYKLIYTPHAVMWHRVSATMNKNYLKRTVDKMSPMQHYYSTRNRIWVVRKNGSAFEKALTIALLTARGVWRIPLFLLRRRGAALGAVWKGLWDGVRTDLSR